MTLLKGITPTPAQVAKAYKEVFDDVVIEAGGKDARISKAAARRLAKRGDAGKLLSDNLLNYLEATGQKTVGAKKFSEVVAAYVERESKKAAGPNQRLSLLETRTLPKDLQADVLHLRGKDNLESTLKRVTFDENGVYEILEGWRPSASVNQGQVELVGQRVVVSGLNSVGEYDAIAREVLSSLWENVLSYRSESGEAVEIGSREAGTLGFGEVRDASDGAKGVMVYWRDIDDNSFAWFYEKQNDGSFSQKHEVYLN